MPLKFFNALLRHLDSLRALASSERIQEISYPHVSQQTRNSMEMTLRGRLHIDTSRPPVRTKAEFKARMAVMGIKVEE